MTKYEANYPPSYEEVINNDQEKICENNPNLECPNIPSQNRHISQYYGAIDRNTNAPQQPYQDAQDQLVEKILEYVLVCCAFICFVMLILSIPAFG